MYTLRQAIHQRLNEINEERRQLGDERKQLFEMLKGLEVAAGTVDTSSVLQTMNQTVQALSELVPQVPASVVIQEIARKMEANEMKVEEMPVNLEAVKEAAVMSKLDSPVVKKGRYNMNEVCGLVIAYLRGHGGYASTADIAKYLSKEHDIYYKDWSQAFWNIRNADPRIQKAGRGFLAFKADGGDSSSEEESEAHEAIVGE